MKRNWWIILGVFALAAWVVGMSSLAVVLAYRDATMPAAAPNLDGFKFRFGTLVNDGQNNYSIAEETTTIPMRFGDSSYGFQVIPPDDTPYTTQFIYHFPYAPKVISGDVFESNTPSATMRSQKGEMHGSYVQDLGFDPGDPVGPQSIDILIDNKRVKTIDFTVTAPTDDQK